MLKNNPGFRDFYFVFMDIEKIYKKLLLHFGPQGWWPIFDKKSQQCSYFTTIGSRKSDSGKKQFEICIGAILTQNTAWKNVEKALCNLSRAECLSPEKILKCHKLEELIRPAGYYNQKAKKLRIFSEWWKKNSPSLSKEGLREVDLLTTLRLKLLNLWGIGPETADSMLLYAFKKPIFVVDAYTKRLCRECGVEFNTYDQYCQFFESQFPKSVRLDSEPKRAKFFNEYHALIVAWGKLYGKNKKAALELLK